MNDIFKRAFLKWNQSFNLPEPIFEHRFHPVRQWRFDIAYLQSMIAVEIEGAVWIRGRHTRPKGFIKDIEKYNEATILGWGILRVPTDWIYDGRAFNYIQRGLNASGS